MSFVRVRRTHSAAGVPRKKKAVRRKPAWDDTVQDLTTLRATPEEIAYRKASHQSKHALVTRLQKQNRQQERAKKNDLSISNAEARQLAIMKEVLYDQHQFQKTIAKSDEMMNQVKDLFGDDPRRFAAFPKVTNAPSGDADNRSSRLIGKHPPIHTRMETLSESVMDGSALNDFEHSDSDEEYDAPDPITYQPKMNIERFQQFLASEEKNQSMSTISGQAQLSQLAQGPTQSTQLPLDPGSLQTTQENVLETPKKSANESISILRTPRSAINDTRKIKKTKKRVAPPPTPPHNSSALNLTDLRKVLEGLQDEIAEYEKQTGRRPAAEKQRQESFSGYTLSLIESVTKISRYMKENDIRLRAETTIREQLMQDVSQMASLIDALTSDIILTQEELGKTQRDFDRYKVHTQTEIEGLKLTLQKAGLMDRNEEARTPPKSSASLQHSQETEDVRQSSAIPDHLQDASSAVLLSPPVRKTRLQREQEQAATGHPSHTGRQTSLIDVATMGSNENNNANTPSVPSSVGQQNAGPLTAVSNQQGLLSNMYQGSIGGGPRYGTHSEHMPQQISTACGNVSSSVSVLQPPANVSQPPANVSQLPTTVSQPPASVSQPPTSSNDLYLNSMQHTGISHQRQPVNVQQVMPHGAVQAQGWPYNQDITTKPGQGSVLDPPHVSAARVTVPRPSPLVQSNVGVPLQRMVTPVGHSDMPPYQQNRIDVMQRGQGVGMAHLGPGLVQMPSQNQPSVQHSSQGQGSIPLNQNTNAFGAAPTGEFNSKNLLAAQIAELNKQHEEAQIRLQSLMQQQQQTQEDHKTHQLSMARAEQELQQRPGNKAPPQQGLPSYPVSPPISPISQRSDKYLGLQGLTMKGNANVGVPRGITVAIPGMSLDNSTDLESSLSPRRA